MSRRRKVLVGHPELGLPETRELWDTHGLFSDHYLKKRIRENAWWPSDEQARPIWEFCRDLYNKRYVPCAQNNEAFTRQELLNKILEKLGFAWTDNLGLPAGQQDLKPDYIVYASAEDKEKVIAATAAKRYAAAAAILEAKKINHPLSRISTHQQRYPHQQIRDYLSEAQVLNWGILTSGNEWRLYCRDAKPSEFFALHFDAAIQSLDNFKYFLALFGPAALVRDAQGKCRLDHVRESATTAQSQLEADLRARIFGIVENLAKGFAERPENRIADADLPRLYGNCLIFLYRLLFILYAEGRQLLPVEPRSRKYYKQLSLARLVSPLQHFIEYDSQTQIRLCREISELCRIINGTDEKANREFGVPRYNGGLFDPERYLDLERWLVSDAVLADVLRSLIFNPPPDRQQPSLPIETIDFADLSVQQLGSIYEGLLEHHFVRENGRLTLKTDRAERKATGTYYTPDYIVKYIVEHTVGPLIEEIEQREAVKAAVAAGRQDNSFAENVLKLNICDPAMGSGHFLVEATVYLADHIVYHPTTRFQAEFERGKWQDQAEVAYWRRRVVEACIYGVDLNPLAVELAKLSLWLVTIATDQPLNFLDHHLRCGNSLIGARLEQLAHLPRKKGKADDREMFSSFGPDFKRVVAETIRQIQRIENAASGDVAAVKDKEKLWNEIISPALAPYKNVADLWVGTIFGNELDEETYVVKAQAILSGPANSEKTPARRNARATPEVRIEDRLPIAKNRHFFHWELEFPEVFFTDDGAAKETPGFDAVIGNPPYGIVFNREEKPYLEWRFPSFIRNNDLYVAFAECVVGICRLDGLSSLIVPNTFILGPYFKGLRHFLKEQTKIMSVLDFGTIQVFDDPNVFNAVFICARRQPSVDTSLPHARFCQATFNSSGVHILGVREIKASELEDERWKIDHPIILKMRESGARNMDTVAWVKDVGFNYWTIGRGKKRGGSIGSRVLYDGEKQYPEDIPYLKGGDFTRYGMVESNNHWLRHNWQTFLAPEVDIFGFSREFLCVHEKLVYRQTSDELIASIDTNGCLVDKTVHMIVLRESCREYSHKYLLATLNSKPANFAYRDFAQEEGRAFAQVKIFNVKRLPIPRIAFTTSEAERKRLAKRGREIYEVEIQSDRDGSPSRPSSARPAAAPYQNDSELIRFVGEHLQADRTDVIHDLLAFLAERMMALNKERHSAARQFLTDLKDFHGVDVHSLTPKTKLDEFWNLEAAAVFEHLHKNRKTLAQQGARLNETDEEKIRARFLKSRDKIVPLERQIAFTDRLIDQIVYRLYDLTDEEIKLVEAGQ